MKRSQGVKQKILLALDGAPITSRSSLYNFQTMTTAPIPNASLTAGTTNRLWRWTPTVSLIMGIALAAALTLHSPMAMAETFKKISTDQLERLMKAEGYSTKRDKDGDLVWTSDGMRWMVVVSPKGNAITVRFTVTDKASLERVNEWNRTKSFSRSFLDKDGDPALELDIELNGGVEKERIHDFFRTAAASRVLWIKEVFKD